ncbi:MAG: DEAD/DEAH box helicase [Acidimicrobiaceae bacterium]|nr:DEAD/DEAH box helicase [Acidimicrobiaceae bacterium]MYF42902.1 DEAD/DEAH box helicase [Acidimicrobiaceae bacterium]
MPMDVFSLRDRVISEYRGYSEGFVEIADERIRSAVDDAFDRGLLWPDPRIGLNPSFEPGATVEELVSSGRLHPLAEEIFRKDKSDEDPQGQPMTLHRHQVQAIDAAADNRSYVLTTGTGSGKSLAYIVPIVDHVLRAGSGQGIKALVLYPMNALANSQYEELGKFLDHGPWTAENDAVRSAEVPTGQRPVSFAVFTGQQNEAERQAIRDNPPDVLLTNYVMAELILTRYNDIKLVNAMASLRFLVLDELHTYRGRQGADVAMLVRRIREACGATELQCVGTSATLSTEGSHAERNVQVATVASRLFGTEVRPSEVISETLRRTTPEPSDRPDFTEALIRSITVDTPEPTSYDAMRRDPLSSWIESSFGLETRDGRLVRAHPIPIEGDIGGAEMLSSETGLSQEDCGHAIRRRLLAGTRIRSPKNGNPVFAFRLHQFLSAGGAAHATPEAPDDRSVTMRAQRFVRNEPHRKYLPLAFCRACGQEYYVVFRETSETSGQGEVLAPRDLGERTASDAQPGFLFIAPEPGDQWDQPWPVDTEGIRARLPPDWFDADDRLRDARRGDVPVPLWVAADGSLHHSDASDGTQTTMGFWLTAPFRFCMRCEMSYADPRGSDFSRLAPLDSQGRSTATTITSLAAIRHLRREDELPRKARKLLSFTDNRQDASLQAGHLNDFVNVTTLRAALWRALSDTGAEGLSHDLLASRVVQALGLHEEAYALQPGARGRIQSMALKALTEVVEYRLYLDLRRGWRVNLPNLEQCGMLRFDYPGLEELAADADEWRHPLTAGASPDTRLLVLRALLETGRRGLGIFVGVLDPDEWGPMERRSEQHLIDQWSVAGERQTWSSLIATGPRSPVGRRRITSLTPRSGFGRFLNRGDTFGAAENLPLDERLVLIDDLVEALMRYGLLRLVEEEGQTRTWQIPAAAMVWKLGDGTPYHDPIRTPSAPETGMSLNPYFVDLYKGIATALGTQPGSTDPTEESASHIEAREHTAQVTHELRQEREHRFRDGDLPVLFCSPTMELGVDIAELNVVNMRNVPPTPANYAQRSGRAGRGGQPALVTTFCSSGSSHDQYFFREQELMVSGEVEAPRLDLANEELVRSHVHSVWLACSGLDLGSGMGDLLDLSSEGEEPSLRLLDQAADVLADRGVRNTAHRRAQGILDDLGSELADADWFTPSWLDDTMRAIPQRFEEALSRWRSLYRSAYRQAAEQGRIRLAHGRSKADRDRAEVLRREAEHQIELLTGERGAGLNSDFYPYRYLASEGFLPGYSFPRLPLSAYVSRRGALRGDLLQRPRFLAISEFGPHSIIYHEGSQYSSNRVQLVPADLDEADGSASILKTSVKRCESCGYIHQVDASSDPDLCELCLERLPPATRNMFRMRNVSTRRRDRITSDEEQRRRQGYEILSAVRFSHRSRVPSYVERFVTAMPPAGSGIEVETPRLLRLRYGDAATIWRINRGLHHSRNPVGRAGFVLDVATGYWSSDDEDEQPDDGADAPPTARRTERVIPYVTDTRNALLIEPVANSPSEVLPGLDDAEAAEDAPDVATMASVQAALSKALQVVFRLESNEVAAEPLPSRDDRRLLLVYEAEEGGAGVLKQLVDDPALWSHVAAEALRICHTDPGTRHEDDAGTGEDGACEGACYDCLMSYSNQPDHDLLYRELAVEFLAPFVTGASFLADAHDATLAEGAESGLEREFLEFLGEHGYRRPDRGQVFFEEARTRPDFVYDDACAVVYVDGPHHDYPERARRDAEQSAAMQNLGFQVIRFGYRDDWSQIVGDNPAVFGRGREGDGS